MSHPASLVKFVFVLLRVVSYRFVLLRVVWRCFVLFRDVPWCFGLLRFVSCLVASLCFVPDSLWCCSVVFGRWCGVMIRVDLFRFVLRPVSRLICVGSLWCSASLARTRRVPMGIGTRMLKWPRAYGLSIHCANAPGHHGLVWFLRVHVVLDGRYGVSLRCFPQVFSCVFP